MNNSNPNLLFFYIDLGLDIGLDTSLKIKEILALST